MKTSKFKMTEIGEIPADWEVKRFDDTFEHVSSKLFQIQSSECQEGGRFEVVDQGQKEIVGYTDDEKKLFHVPSGGIIIFGDHTRIIKFRESDFVVGADGTQLLAGKEDFTRFLFYVLQQLDIPNLGYSRHFKYLKEGRYVIPSSHLEQKAIAAALSDVDALIAAQEELIEKKRAIKHGAMQELLTGKKRLPGFGGKWMEKRLGDCALIKARIGWQGLTTDEYLENGQYYLITGSDFRDGKVNWSQCYYVDKSRYEQDKNIQIQKNDVLVSKDGTIGKVAFLDEIPGEGTLNSGIFVIRTRDKEIEQLYMAWVFLSKWFDDFINRLVAGSTIVHLYQKDMVGFEFPVPPTIAEQKAIAKVLSDMDAEISGLEAQKAKFESVKQGMMQELLTGKTRLKGV